MRIYNETKTQILENIDLNKGYLKHDKITTNTIPAQEEVAEQFHYEYKTYQNGGKDRIKIIDVPYQPAKPETYEYEDIQIYIPYTEEQLKEQYENKIVTEIRKKYTVNQELGIQRKRYTEPEKFTEYNEYIEQCIAKVKNAFDKE